MQDTHAIYNQATGLYESDGYHALAPAGDYKEFTDAGYCVLCQPDADRVCFIALDPVTGQFHDILSLESLGRSLGIVNPADPESHRKRIFTAGHWPVGPIVYASKIVEVQELPVGTLGAPFPWQVVRVSNSVAFLVYNSTKDELLFATQDRAPMMSHENPKGTMMEVGAGRFDRNIGVEGLVVKELKEELGVTVTVDEVQLLNNGVPVALSPGVLTEKQYLAFVEITDDRIDHRKQLYGLRAEGERIARRFIPVQDVFNNTIQIEDMKTWALVQWFMQRRQRTR
ncbi:hypothetical protein [uncultured Thiodictyon sp.]|uniref:hypothetical protein n=1 Tax=uncultured Thiodictyon sp. TaxID=1846217 RepID=UPI0025F3032E|nr:hypothetical protein [uncultured Thiodictyon sp.]